MSRKRDTFLNECRKFFPGCTAEEANTLVWGCTAFPFAPLEHCRKQLREASLASNRNPQAAFKWVDDEIHAALRDMFEKEEIDAQNTEPNPSDPAVPGLHNV